MRLNASNAALLCFATFRSSVAFEWASLAKDLERRQTLVGTGITPSDSSIGSPSSSLESSTPTEQVRTSTPSASDTPSDGLLFTSSDNPIETFQQTSSTPPFTTSDITSTPSSASVSTPETPTTPSSTPDATTSSSFSSSSAEPSSTSQTTSSSSSRGPDSVSSSPLVSTGSLTVVTTVFTVDGNGQSVTSILTSATPIYHTTGYSTVTPEASLNSGNNGGSSGSGLSDSSKRVIGGVVGGVGGAIVLAALGFVAWRLWGKKRGQPVDDDYHYSAAAPGHAPSASVGTENTVGTTGTTGTTGLEKYDQPHRPAATPNATTATNF